MSDSDLRGRPDTAPAAAPTRQQRRSDRTRGRLLDAAFDAMVERGYERVSLSEITERADLGTGTLYLHFRDKRGLYEALVRRELGRLRARWLGEEAAAAPPSADPAPAVARMIGVTLHFFTDNPDKARLLLCDGPPLETWLVDDVGRAIAEVIGPTVAAPELLANLIVGALLAAGRWSVQPAAVAPGAPPAPPRLATERLIAATVGFCAGGLAGLSRPEARGAHAVAPRSADTTSHDKEADHGP